MNMDDFMTLYRVLHQTDHTTKSNLEIIMRPDVPADRIANWIDNALESAEALVDRLLVAAQGLGGDFFEKGEPPAGVAELVESLGATKTKIAEAYAARRRIAKEKKVKKRKLGDPNQDVMFGDDHDPTNDVAPGDPG